MKQLILYALNRKWGSWGIVHLHLSQWAVYQIVAIMFDPEEKEKIFFSSPNLDQRKKFGNICFKFDVQPKEGPFLR